MPPAYVKTLREAREDRRSGCRGDLRGRHAPDHGVRCGEERGTAGDPDASQDPGDVGPPADRLDQRLAVSSGRIWHRHWPGARRPEVAGEAFGPER